MACVSRIEDVRPFSGNRKPALRDVSDLAEHIGQPCLRIDVVELGRHSVVMAAARSAPRSEPAKSHDFLPSANPEEQVRGGPGRTRTSNL
jgi:hypothetical protein